MTNQTEWVEAASKVFSNNCIYDYSGQAFRDGMAAIYLAMATGRLTTPYQMMAENSPLANEILNKAFEDVKQNCGVALTQVNFDLLNTSEIYKSDYILIDVSVEGKTITKGESA